MVEMEMGAILRTAREAAGLSLAAMARRTSYSKAYLGRVETGQRRATAELVAAYERALGDDVDRRSLLMGLMAGAVTPVATSEAVAAAFDAALSGPHLTVDDWLGRLEGYGHDYMSVGAGDLQARLASDLVRLRERLDHPVLCAVAARLLTVHGKTIPSAEDRGGAIDWYQRAVWAADRSGDVDVRVWTRGRGALALAYEGAALPTAEAMATAAVGLADGHPSLGLLNAQLALGHTQGQTGRAREALATLDQARRTFDVIGSDEQISDFAIPEWRMATISSLLLSRLGEEHRAIEAQETADRTRPGTLPRFATHIELHRGLMMARSGDKSAGVNYARHALTRLPVERHSLSLRLMMTEIEAT